MDIDARVILGDSRVMKELKDASVELVVTSPPYWHIKDYDIESQVGYGQTLHEYLEDLYRVWRECFRVLCPGRRLCINIGDQFARASIYGRYKIMPLHAEVISQCEDLGFDYMGSIIWQKRTTLRTSGGATIMGSYPYPPNGIIEIDHEHILIFKRPGKSPKVPTELKQRSKLTKEEWKEYFSGHWTFGGARKKGHEAMFPEELPRRLIRMFTFEGETVLDPFLGSGTSMKVAMDLDRGSVGYEINPSFLDLIKEKLGIKGEASRSGITITERGGRTEGLPDVPYVPRIKDARPTKDPKDAEAGPDLHKVTEIIDGRTLRLATGQKVRLMGITIDTAKGTEALEYLRKRVLKKKVILRFDGEPRPVQGVLRAYVYLKNRIFVNAYMIRSGLALPDAGQDFSMKDRFMKMVKKDRVP